MTTISTPHTTTHHWSRWMFAVLAAAAVLAVAITLTVSAVWGSDDSSRPQIRHGGAAPTLCVGAGGAKVC
jgi:hypothetical protein